ncbi:hypothetical protein [Enterovibrio baiacu]|uniref:hypothetical protein n=1 Tax=Enterovibrio baiacu TaxID=2491023 RepID=UPI001010B7B5|nr:hypothetical protein [Enterovibrio baiacu]MBE1277790.1 hypothetical protein [Enterovibrio baiacu]
MTLKNIDMTNTDDTLCTVFESDGVSDSPCAAKQFDDVLYIPQRKCWYLISAKDAKALKDEADDLDAMVKPLIDKLYSKSKKPEDAQNVKNAVLQNLNQKGVLENYKSRSHLHFLEKPEDKKAYAQALYTRALLNSYANLIKSAARMPNLEAIKDNLDAQISQYSSQLGLTTADLTEGTIAAQAIRSVERKMVFTPKSSSLSPRMASRNRQKIDAVIRQIEKHIKTLEKKAQDIAKEKGFDWYKSQQDQSFRFVKSENRHIENHYQKYLTSKHHFRHVYENFESPDEMEVEFKKYCEFSLTNRPDYRVGPLFHRFMHLNSLGIVVPEQILTRDQLYTSDEDVKTTLNEAIGGMSATDRQRFIKWGNEIKHSLNSSLSYAVDDNAPVPLDDRCKGKGVIFIKKLGYDDVLALIGVWDSELVAYIKAYIDDILGGSAPASGYADGGMYFLLALRYHLDYLKHLGRDALSEGKVAYTIKDAPYNLSERLTQKMAMFPLEDVYWSAEDIDLEEYRFAWKESDTHIVEFFLLSEKNKPRYMHSIQLEKLDHAISTGKATLLDLKEQVHVASAQVDVADLKKAPSSQIKKRLRTAISDASKAAKANSNRTVSLSATVPDSDLNAFSQYTSLIQASFTHAGGEDLTYVVNAQVELFRFCSDKFRFEANYPEDFTELAKQASQQAKTEVLSLQAEGFIDLAAGSLKTTAMMPDRNGYAMLLPAVVEREGKETSQYYHLGQLRADVEALCYGSVGVGFAFAASAKITSKDTGLRLDPVIPAETTLRLPSIGSIRGEVDLFAGARTGISVATTAKWCKPGGEPKARNFIAHLNEGQVKTLESERRYKTTPNEGWVPLGTFMRSRELSFGIGARYNFLFGYVRNKFVVKCGGGLTFKVGGGMDMMVALYPESLLDIVTALTDTLACEEFRRVEMFAEGSDDNNDTGGYRLLNTLLTMSMVTGIDLANLALLPMTEVIAEEKKILVREHAGTVAEQVNVFFSKTDKKNATPWFKNLPPDARARLLFTLTQESDLLSPELMGRIKRIEESRKKRFGEKEPKLSRAEEKQLSQGVSEEAPRWLAMARLLESWSVANIDIQRDVNRQIEKTFARYNVNGTKHLASHYGNRILPIVVWERLKGFMQRMDECGATGQNNQFVDTTMFDDDVIKIIRSSIVRLDNYFSSYLPAGANGKPAPKYETRTFTGKSRTLTYIVFNGDYRNEFGDSELSDEAMRFGYYHLARKEIFPEDYENESNFFNDNAAWREQTWKDVKAELNVWIEAVTGIEDSFGKVETLDNMKTAAENGDYEALFKLLGTQ